MTVTTSRPAARTERIGRSLHANLAVADLYERAIAAGEEIGRAHV